VLTVYWIVYIIKSKEFLLSFLTYFDVEDEESKMRLRAGDSLPANKELLPSKIESNSRE
jgi:hypothetical protein